MLDKASIIRKSIISDDFRGANPPRILWELSIRTRELLLNNQWTIHGVSGFCPDMLHLCFVFIAHIVKPQAVRLRVNQLLQFKPKAAKLGRINDTFKHRVLHPLSVILTFFRNLRKTPASLAGNGTYVVGDQYEHFVFLLLYFQSKGGYSSRSPRIVLASSIACA